MKATRGADSKTLVEEVKRIISEYDTKLTLRQIYYQLVSKHLIENIKSQYQRLSKILVEARHNGTINWEDMEDRTRAAKGGDDEEKTPEEHFNQALNYLRNCYGYFDLPKWKNQPNYVEIWFEKQALEGIFESVTNDWNVVQLACRGYSSHTMGYELSKRLAALDEKRKVSIFYFGDFDPSGLDIYRFIKDMCERFNLVINFERVAITKEQIKKYKIPPMFAKSSDSRYGNFVAEHGKDVVELDALRPDVLQKLIKDSINSKFDHEISEQIEEEQERDRTKIQTMVSKTLRKG